MSVTPTILHAMEQSAVVELDVTSGPHAGLRFRFDQPSTLLAGRSADAQLRLENDPHFSRNHFLLEIIPPECQLTDLSSSNGTFVNGERIERFALKHGDLISGGDTTIRVSLTLPQAVDGPATQTFAPAGPAPLGISKPKQAPARLGAYESLQQIGEGAMGIVYRARHSRSGRDVALKVMKVNPQAGTRPLQLFLREASILSSLNHPRIVRFEEFGMAEGTVYLAMEFVETIDLPTILDGERRRHGIHIACGLISQVLQALEHAHSLSLVHRDVKPSNVLVSKVGTRLQAKLADFGLAKNYWNSGCSGITHEGEARGTLAFMPPEQLTDCRNARPASDLYSTGATLFWFLTGKPPLELPSGGSALKTILEQPPMSLREARAEIPHELDAIIQRALQKDPNQRFSSAAEMRKALLPFTKARRG